MVQSCANSIDIGPFVKSFSDGDVMMEEEKEGGRGKERKRREKRVNVRREDKSKRRRYEAKIERIRTRTRREREKWLRNVTEKGKEEVDTRAIGWGEKRR